VVFCLIIGGKQAEKCLISQFFCASPSRVLEQRRRFEQLIVAQVLDALRFTAQRNTPASLFAPLDLHATSADLSSGADANVQLPTAASLDRVNAADSASGTAVGSGNNTTAALTAAAAASAAALGTASASSVPASSSASTGGSVSASAGAANAAAAAASGIHAESGAFVLDLSLCDASERSWLADAVAERRRSSVTDADGGDADEPRFFVFWRAIYATCFTLVCDEIDNRQLAARWLDVMARMIAEHFRNAFILQTPEALLSQPGEIHCLISQLLPCGQLLFNSEAFVAGQTE
jgi:hypothetical protein